MQSSDILKIEFKAEGFGFPGSSIINHFVANDSAETLFLNFSQDIRGIFSELEQNNLISIPATFTGNLFLSSEKGDLKIYIPENSNWLIVPATVATITDSSNYLTQMKSFLDPYLTITTELPSGNLEIIR